MESHARYESFVHRRLDALDVQIQNSGGLHRLPFDVQRSRMVIFSDLHRGTRNGADDFARSERAYLAALAYYFEAGYTLVILGDAEELWEEYPTAVLRAYTYALQMETRFYGEGRYLRVWGNHDDAWSHASLVDRHLQSFFPGIHVHEGLQLDVAKGTEALGRIVLVHGHQGTSSSDRYAALSRLFVRFVWRNIQRLFRISLNTPAKDWSLRVRHNAALYSWAARQKRTLLLAGHTHRPVFRSLTHAARVEAELRLLRSGVGSEHPPDPALLAKLAAQIEWIKAQERQVAVHDDLPVMQTPCYFNSGCCCYLDGDITGIELADGQIRLVRWPDNTDNPVPAVLADADLVSVFSALEPAVGPSVPSTDRERAAL